MLVTILSLDSPNANFDTSATSYWKIRDKIKIITSRTIRNLADLKFKSTKRTEGEKDRGRFHSPLLRHVFLNNDVFHGKNVGRNTEARSTNQVELNEFGFAEEGSTAYDSFDRFESQRTGVRCCARNSFKSRHETALSSTTPWETASTELI